jgi:crotonobetainyl-CoA:carnitine CoA-transferase CaiB-like acyl-CoA transferase
MDAPLKGIRIIDWSIWQQGPAATTTLADMGAEVIKIEDRKWGDPGRGMMPTSPPLGGKGGIPNFLFECNNRHKKSVGLDLKRPEAREVVYRLVEKSDVFVQNFRVGVAERLGLDYPTLKARNPRLIYAYASGYGPEGPDAGEPSYDLLAQARSGIMMTVGGEPAEPPRPICAGVADEAGAIVLALGIVTAIVARDKYGVGQQVDTSLLGSMTLLQRLNVSSRAMVGREFGRVPRTRAVNPLWNHYRCADGKWLCFGMAEPDRYWKDFCTALGLEELIEDPRFSVLRVRAQNAAELIAILDGTFEKRTRDEWLPILKSHGDLIYTVVNSIADLPNDPQVVANEYIVDYDHPGYGKLKLVGMPIRFSQTPANPRGHAPKLGEHTEAVLSEFGYSAAEIARLRDAGVI